MTKFSNLILKSGLVVVPVVLVVLVVVIPSIVVLVVVVPGLFMNKAFFHNLF